ncbi:2-hydroxyacid dehydrogenase [Sinomicrobium weinanense]|uniref:2-hydroxyacid dehydrogenase n=1 Tax=Sinomicrobium weinanense TaxID=2842200 RepID=A0A926Q1H5_9FLAO|nr:2-hydroxyacid dehydrogenase [Sinomicrobium weinanense]MBC9795757.1 2-hydroxyacid dehydrogenase [Sinomicrobium weinanense]MBU3121801.1 2-hydroxyacid dehydrogenase [Sinomicrobium weinanense]
MKILFYSVRAFEKPYLQNAGNHHDIQVVFTEESLDPDTAVLALNFDAVSLFTGDDASATVLEILKEMGVKYIALRSAGYDHVNLSAAGRLGLEVANVPDYSPYAIAEHAVALLLALNRRLTESHKRVSGFNFNINGLTGFDLHGKTVGIIGTGRIGSVMTKIMHGFGCKLLGYDIHENDELQQKYGLRYATLRQLCAGADMISVHAPLNKDTYHLLDRELFGIMRKGVTIINTARGAIIKTEDLLEALENSTIGALGMDVYEREKEVFFKDCSKTGIEDMALKKLIGMPNVLITSHHAFLTAEALTNIADTVFQNVLDWQHGKSPASKVP